MLSFADISLKKTASELLVIYLICLYRMSWMN